MGIKHPDTIVIKNKFYPTGLTEYDVYSYYLRNKNKLIKFNRDRNVLFFIATDNNKTVVRRKLDNQFINLNETNFDDIINGRVISIHSIMKKNESFGIIDIDHCDGNCPDMAQEVVSYLQSFTKNNQQTVKIQFTGKNSFHIYVYFNNKFNINHIRQYLYKILSREFENKYLVGSTTRSHLPKIDLSSNKINGAYISPYSLSVWGLQSVYISINELKRFNPDKYKIKTKQI